MRPRTARWCWSGSSSSCARISLWAAGAPYTVEPRISDDRTAVSFLAMVVAPPPTDEWSLYLGDALHALRSAVDACVWELAHLDGQEPSKPRMVGFPDCRTAADWNRARRDKRQTVPDLYAERIKQVQPFSTQPAPPSAPRHPDGTRHVQGPHHRLDPDLRQQLRGHPQESRLFLTGIPTRTRAGRPYPEPRHGPPSRLVLAPPPASHRAPGHLRPGARPRPPEYTVTDQVRRLRQRLTPSRGRGHAVATRL